MDSIRKAPSMEQIILSVKALGAAIKRWRKSKNLTQQAAGEAFNIGQVTVSSIENGAPGTKLETLFRMLAALDLELVIRPKNKSQKANTRVSQW